MGEIACVAIHRDYRGSHRGERLMQSMKERAFDHHINQLFVLTTVTSHWFLEQGFVEKSVNDLPNSKKDIYNFTRNSKVFVLSL